MCFVYVVIIDKDVLVGEALGQPGYDRLVAFGVPQAAGVVAVVRLARVDAAATRTRAVTILAIVQYICLTIDKRNLAIENLFAWLFHNALYI